MDRQLRNGKIAELNVFKVKDGGTGFGSVSPLKLTSTLKRELENVRHSKTLANANGMLMLR